MASLNYEETTRILPRVRSGPRIALVLELVPAISLVAAVVALLTIAWVEPESGWPLLVFVPPAVGFCVSGAGWWNRGERRTALLVLLGRSVVLLVLGYYLGQDTATSDCGGPNCHSDDNSFAEAPLFIIAFLIPVISTAALWRFSRRH